MIARILGVSILLATFAGAQSGLPKYGVFLEGTVSSPIIVNHSSHRILAYCLLFDHGSGVVIPSLQVMLGQLRRQPMSAVGIAPGGQHLHQPVAQVADAKGQLPNEGPIALTLDSVLFEDGTLVGPDKSGSFDQLTARIQAEKDVHAVLKNGGTPSAWTALERIASGQTSPAPEQSRSQGYRSRYQAMFRASAVELLNVRSRAGDAAANDLARSSAFYPAIVKGE